MRGFFGIGIEHVKTSDNIGTLFRSAAILGADFCFTVGRRYRKQCTDTIKSWRHMPLWNFQTLDQLIASIPLECKLVGVELVDSAVALKDFPHPERACYLLGAEDHGLTKEAIRRCHSLIRLPGERSLNVSACGTVVIYDRITRAFE